MIFPITKSRYRVLKEIYENPGIIISELMRKTRVSPKMLYEHDEKVLP